MKKLFETNKIQEQYKNIKFNSIQDVEDFAKELCAKHGIPDTRIEWAPLATRRYGQANHRQKLITLSKQPVEHNLDKVYAITDLILHEIAHLLVGPKHGHDEVWKSKCVEIGAVPETCIRDNERALPVPHKFRYRCPNCGKEFTTPRRKYGVACKECCDKYNKGEWDAKFVWKLVE